MGKYSENIFREGIKNKSKNVIAIPTECREKPVWRQTGNLIIFIYYSYKEIASVVNSLAKTILLLTQVPDLLKSDG